MSKHFKKPPEAAGTGSTSVQAPAQPARTSAVSPLPATRMYQPTVHDAYVKGSKPAGAKPRRRRGNILSTLLILVGLGLLAVAGYLWGTAQWRYHQQDQVNKELAAYATVYDTPDQDGTLRPPEVNWEGLKAINDDVCGWLQIPGTTINYPVYQAEDNERYLRHTATGEWTWGGQLFMDFECTRPGLVDNVSLIYGHHLNNGSMFEQIAEMDKQEKFDAVSTIWYVTEQNTYELEPLFLYYTQAEDQDARTFVFDSFDAFHSYLAERLARAVTQRSDASSLLPNLKHVMVLATCNYYDGYGRTLLVCVPKSEVSS